MLPIIYICAAGLTFFPGTLLLVLAVIVRLIWPARWAVRLAIVMAIFGIALVAVSAEAVPFWLYSLWAIACIGWFAANVVGKRRWLRVAATVQMLFASIAVGMALPYQSLPMLSAGNSPIVVIGDSISAGIELRSTSTWPMVLRREHQLNVLDFSRAGSSISDARRGLHGPPLSNAVDLIEIGGNDILSHADTQKFGQDLDALVKTLARPDQQIVMWVSCPML